VAIVALFDLVDFAALKALYRAYTDRCETVPFIDVTAARMLDELSKVLRRREVRLVIARGVGQVRDVLGSGAPDDFRSVREAVDAVRADRPDRQENQMGNAT
jgi:STAS domain